MSKKKVLQDFLEYKRLTIKTEKALKICERYTKMFLDHAKKPLNKFTEKDIVSYFNWLDKNFSASSINDFKVMVKVFVKWHFADWSSRFRNLDKLCKKKNVESTYKAEDLLEIKDVEKLVQEEIEPRWKAYWLVLFYGGFRPDEANKLRWTDITFSGDEAYVSFTATKTGKNFEKYLPNNAVFYLKKIQNNGSKYVFPTKRKTLNATKKDKRKIDVGDKPQTTSGVYQHLRDVAPKIFGRRINPYTLRHSIATILYNKEGVKDADAAQQLGHTEGMKKVYSHPSKQTIREKMKKLYIKAEELPPEKKADYEKRIEALENFIEGLKGVGVDPETGGKVTTEFKIIRGKT